VEAAILLVGEYPVLLRTRAQLLKEWQTSTTDSAAAAQVLRERRYDLLIFCQSIRGSTAQILIAHARTLYPDIMVLALSYAGEQRPDIYHPNKLRETVADLLIKANTKRKNKIRYCVGKT
jgi:CheY-like chemotaxis protein